jgi:hypothetical protein
MGRPGDHLGLPIYDLAGCYHRKYCTTAYYDGLERQPVFYRMGHQRLRPGFCGITAYFRKTG